MRFWITCIVLMLSPLLMAGAFAAQNLDAQQQALIDAKAKMNAAQNRSEVLQQEASNAGNAADRLVAQRAVLSAQIESAATQISAARARIAIISNRQAQNKSRLAVQSAPMMRLIAAMQQWINQPASLMLAKPGSQRDYIHLRAVMASVQPVINRRTLVLRQQIASQNDLRAQESLAIGSLNKARSDLVSRRQSLAALALEEGGSDALTADAAIEFEQSIAQGERARDLIENIDTMRTSNENASDLAGLDGPILMTGYTGAQTQIEKPIYSLPQNGHVVFGFNEMNETGYRERGLRFALAAGSAIAAPAAGHIIYSGPYRSYGNIIIIEHGNGWTSLLTNMGSLSVAKGAQVAQGQILSRAGANNPDVTIELRRNGRIVDIAALLF